MMDENTEQDEVEEDLDESGEGSYESERGFKTPKKLRYSRGKLY